MALSDHEQQLFDQLERELRENDPDFVSSISSETPESPQATQLSVRKIVLGVVAVLVGLGLIIWGVSTKIILLGVLGFLVAAGGVYWASTSDRGAKSAERTAGASTAAPRRRESSTFMKNLEQRWDNRQGGSF